MWEKTRHEVSRRKLLRGLGAAAALVAPFTRHRLADAATAGNFLVFISPNGHVRAQFGGTGEGADWQFKPALSPLEPYKADVAVIRGLCNKTSSRYNSHEDMCKLLSMYHGSGGTTTVYGPSFDHELGKALGTQPLTLGVAPIGSNGDIYAAASWVAAGKSDPKLTSPLQAYAQALTGGLMPADGSAAAALVIDRRKSVLDFVSGDIGRFRRRLAGRDAENLDIYLQSLRDVEKRLSGSRDTPATASCDPASAQSGANAAGGVSGGGAKFQAMGEAMLDIVLTAFACGSRRISTLVWQRGSGGINPLGGPSHHDVSHGAASRSVWEAIDRWYAERFGYFIRRARTLGVLDDTIGVWASEISEAHNQCDQVFVAAGGRKRGFRLGQNIVYPFSGSSSAGQATALNASRDPRNKSQADLWVSVQKALGIRKDSVGDAQYCSGGLQELFVG